jgi:hypothetical protein
MRLSMECKGGNREAIIAATRTPLSPDNDKAPKPRDGRHGRRFVHEAASGLPWGRGLFFTTKGTKNTKAPVNALFVLLRPRPQGRPLAALGMETEHVVATPGLRA